MRTREKNFVDVERLKTVFSFQVYTGKKWRFVVGKDGEIKKFETREACNAARAEWRKKPAA